jgi:clan AA aspartic protease
MSSKFIESTAVIEITIENTLLGKTHPTGDRGVMAVLDTGYTGFLFIPKRLFERLHFNDLRVGKAEALLADGSLIELTRALGSIKFPPLDLKIDGIIETSEHASEILVGMEGIRRLIVELDCCRKRLNIQQCS